MKTDQLSKILSSLVVTIFCFTLQPAAVIAGASTLSKAVMSQENMEPSVQRPEQDKVAAKKLAELHTKTGKRPNIVWLIVDDMGWGDPGVYGGGAAIGAATPNMDRLAREGLKLTSTYSQPTCTPTRSAILTGRLPVRTGLTRPILAGDKITKNPWADEISLPKLLGDAGYKTVLSGKWHVGEAEGMRPQDVGFDEFYGYYPAQKELTQAFDKRRYPDLVLNPERLEMLRRTGASEALDPRFEGWHHHGGGKDRQHRIDGRGRPAAQGVQRLQNRGSRQGEPTFLPRTLLHESPCGQLRLQGLRGQKRQQVSLQGRPGRGRCLHR